MKKIHKLVLSAFLIGSLVSCEKMGEFGDTNDNPAAVTNPVIGALLTNVQSGIAGTSYASDTRGGLYAQYFSETQYTDVSVYATPELAFTGYYSGSLMDLQNIINSEESNNMTQIATILQQYIFWHMTNLWGDIPYSEALQGADALQPKYDTQEDIYKGIFAKLGTVVNSFDNSQITGDIIFGGDVEAWKRTANSLKVMAAIQLSKKVPSASGFAATAFKEALAASGGVITSNADNFQVNYPGGSFQSPVFSRYLTRQDYAESEPMVDLLVSLGDERQSKFGSSNVGVPYGVARLDAEQFTSANPDWALILADDVRVDNSTVVIIGAAHVAFARAEAANLGWTSDNAETQYLNGISLSHEQWDVTMDPGYVLQSDVALGSDAAANYDKIALQNYIAHYPNGAMGWNIWRKTGVPTLTPAPAATNSSKEIPRRYVYNQAEFSSNGVHVEEAIGRIPGGNNQDARVWWDQP